MNKRMSVQIEIKLKHPLIRHLILIFTSVYNYHAGSFGYFVFFVQVLKFTRNSKLKGVVWHNFS